MRSLLTLLGRQKKLFPAFLLIVIGGLVFFFFLQNNHSNQTQIYVVKEGEINQSIEATGSLQPTTSIDLSFKKSGQIKSIYFNTGSRVKKGDLLAELENSKENAALQQQQAALHEQKALLDVELAQASQEDIAIAQSEKDQAVANKEKVQVDIENAKTDLDNTQKSLTQDLAAADLDVQNAKLNLEKVQITSLSSTNSSSSGLENAKISYLSSLSQLLIAAKAGLQNVDKIVAIDGHTSIFDGKQSLLPEAEFLQTKNLYLSASTHYNDLKKIYDGLTSNSDLSVLTSSHQQMLDLAENINQMLLTASSMLDKVMNSSDFKLEDLVKLRSDISGTASSFNSSLSSFNLSQKGLDDASNTTTSITGTVPVDLKTAQILVDQKEQNYQKIKINGDTTLAQKKALLKSSQAQLKVQSALVEKAQANFDKLVHPPRQVDLGPYQARVEKASASVSSAQNDFNDTLLQAPFDGIITTRNIEVGEQTSVSTSGSQNTKAAFAMIDDSQFHIDVNIPETQVNRLNTNSKVTVSFDALPDVEFEGTVLTIEPAATTIESTVYYKAKIALTKNDDRLKSDMTANIIIETSVPQKALLVPEKVITVSGGKKTVQVAEDEQGTKLKTIEVVTGTRDKNGFIEIVFGLKAGDRVLVPSL